MESLYFETNSLLQHIHFGLAEMERAQSSEQASTAELRLGELLEKININCQKLDIFVSKEPANRRRTSKYKVDQLKYDYQHLKASLEALQSKLAYRWQHEQNREELLSKRFTTNDSTSLHMDDDLDHNDRLHGAHSGVDDLLDHGHAVLDNLRSQHSSLKGVKRKVLDVFQQLGLSNTVLRLIERRTKEDKYFLFGGMIVTCLLMYFIYRWIKG